MKNSTTLYLIPLPLDGLNPRFMNPVVAEVIHNTTYFVVENLRTARRYIKKMIPTAVIDDLAFFELNHDYQLKDLHLFLQKALDQKQDVGVMSEAGMPCMADPGHQVVQWAHQNNMKVNAISGSSSVLLALVSSGFNGQEFVFHGYLPNKMPALAQKLKAIHQVLEKSNQTQLFIEAPYRNEFMLKSIIQTLPSQTLLCIACELESDQGFVLTQTLAAWQKFDAPSLHKRPCVFAIGTWGG